MITSPLSFVTPRQELARLTLLSPSNEDAIRRRSTLSHTRPTGLGEINGMPVLGPLGPPLTAEAESRGQSDKNDAADREKLAHSEIQETGEAKSVSNITNTTEMLTPQVNDKENEPPPDDIAMKDATNDQTPSPNPSEPPPVPPRPMPEEDRQRQLREEVELGAQQDVTEAINNVLFQSQCAIKPHSHHSDGEQLDQVKE